MLHACGTPFLAAAFAATLSTGSLAFGNTVARGPAKLVLEAERARGAGQVMQRKHASGERTVQLDAGERLILPFRLGGPGRYIVSVRYSNDNDDTKPTETIGVRLDGALLGKFRPKDTGSGGFGWDVFHKTAAVGKPMMLKAGAHKLKLTVTDGDGFGVEIDVATLTRR